MRQWRWNPEMGNGRFSIVSWEVQRLGCNRSTHWVFWVGYKGQIYRTHLLCYSLFKSRETRGKNLEKNWTRNFDLHRHFSVAFIRHTMTIQCGAKWSLASSGMVWCFIYCCSLPSFGAVSPISCSLTYTKAFRYYGDTDNPCHEANRSPTGW